MEHLAKAAGTHKSNYYHHFPGGKEELLRRGLDRALVALPAVFEEPEAVAGPAVDRLRHVLRRAIEIEYDMIAEIALLLRVRGNSDVELQAVERRRDLTKRLAGLVEAAMAEGGIRSDMDPAVVARLLLGVETSMTEWLRRDGGLDADQLADLTLQLVFEGLLPTRRRR